MRIIERLTGGDLMKPEPTQPRQILRRTLIGSAGLLTIIIPMFSLAGMVGQDLTLDFPLSLSLVAWGISLLFLITLPFLQPRIQNAVLNYGLIALAGFPASIAMMDLGYKTIRSHLVTSSLTIIMLGFLGLFLTLPLSIAEERKKFVYDIENGQFRRSFDSKANTWNPGNSLGHNVDDPRRKKPNILIRLLMVSGPAIGMGLSDVVGQANAILIAGLLLLFFGAFAIHGHLSRYLGYIIEFRRLEKEIGKPIFMAELLDSGK